MIYKSVKGAIYIIANNIVENLQHSEVIVLYNTLDMNSSADWLSWDDLWLILIKLSTENPLIVGSVDSQRTLLDYSAPE